MTSIYCSDNVLLSLAQIYMLSGKQDLLRFGEAQPSIFCYFHIFSKLYVTFRKLNNVVKLLDYMAAVHSPIIPLVPFSAF